MCGAAREGSVGAKVGDRVVSISTVVFTVGSGSCVQISLDESIQDEALQVSAFAAESALIASLGGSRMGKGGDA